MCRGLCASDMLKDKNLNFYRKPANATSPHAPTNPKPQPHSFGCLFIASCALFCFCFLVSLMFFTSLKFLEYVFVVLERIVFFKCQLSAGLWFGSLHKEHIVLEHVVLEMHHTRDARSQ